MNGEMLILQWVGTYLVHSTALLLAATLTRWIPALRSPVTQAQIWKVALVVGVLTASAQTLTPLGSPLDLRPGVAVATPSAPPPASVSKPKIIPLQKPDRVIAARAPAKSSPKLQVDEPPSSASWALAFWLAGTGILGFRLMASAVSLRRLLASRTPVVRQDLLEEFYDLACQAGVPFARLSESDAIDQPMASLRGEICVPSRSLALPPHQRRAMLAHELAHVAHRDPVWRWLSRISEALLFFQPLNFLATRELARQSELLADARAIGLGQSSRQLAECLHRFARWQVQPVPAVACGMVHRPSGLVERIQRLLEEDPMIQQRPRHLLLTVGVTLIIGSLVLPGTATGFDWFSSKRGTSVEVSDDNGYTKIDLEHRWDDLRIELEARGRFTFSADESDIVAIDDGGRFDLEFESGGLEERFRFEGDDGQVERQYWRDGDAQPYDEHARMRFAEILPTVFRISGIDAENRVARLLDRGGPDTVLDEVEQIRSDLVARIYLSHLARTADLSHGEMRRVVELAADQIKSDLEHRLALSAMIEHQELDTRGWQTLIESSHKISSDLEQRLVLASAAERMPEDPELIESYVTAAREISSDLEHRLALMALRDSEISERTLSRLIASTEDISSDLEQRLALQAFAEQAARGDAAADYIAAADHISSDIEHRLALDRLIDAGLDEALSVELVDAAGESIGSDIELRLLLSSVLSEHGNSRAVRDAVRAVAEDELSGIEREILMRQLMR